MCRRHMCAGGHVGYEIAPLVPTIEALVWAVATGGAPATGLNTVRAVSLDSIPMHRSQLCSCAMCLYIAVRVPLVLFVWPCLATHAFRLRFYYTFVGTGEAP